MADKWADYLISAVEYGEGRRITRVRQHRDTGGQIDSGQIAERSDVESNLKRGATYATIFSGNQRWRMGERVGLRKAGGAHSIRTDANRVEMDNLGMLPGI